MSSNEICQRCSKAFATKQINVAIAIKMGGSSSYGGDLANASYKYEVCDNCARHFMDEQAVLMRNFSLDLTADGMQRRLIQETSEVTVYGE